MLDYAVLITRDMHRIDEAVITSLRARGLSDEDILNVAQVAALFNYYTRLAEALGVEPEDFMIRR